MSEQLNEFDENQFDDEASALAALKVHAERMGVKFHPSIGYDALHAKITSHMKSEGNEDNEPVNVSYQLPEGAGLVPETTQETFNRMRKELKALVRIQIQCLDPLYKEWDGAIFTFSNDLVTIRRYVPFNVPWHIEKALAHMIEEKQYQYFTKKKNDQGFEYKESRLGKSYNVAYLDKLNETEIAMLALKQAKQGI